jgi:hypothetical protein
MSEGKPNVMFYVISDIMLDHMLCQMSFNISYSMFFQMSCLISTFDINLCVMSNNLSKVLLVVMSDVMTCHVRNNFSLSCQMSCYMSFLIYYHMTE